MYMRGYKRKGGIKMEKQYSIQELVEKLCDNAQKLKTKLNNKEYIKARKAAIAFTLSSLLPFAQVSALAMQNPENEASKR